MINLKKGDFCVAGAIRADESQLADWGGRQGKRLTVQSKVTPDHRHPGMVRVRYTVEDAPVDYVGEVIIVGNTVTKDEVIRRELSLMPGQLLDTRCRSLKRSFATWAFSAMSRTNEATVHPCPCRVSLPSSGRAPPPLETVQASGRSRARRVRRV